MKILAVRLRTATSWDALRQAAAADADVFVPTTSPLAEGAEVVLELGSPLLPNRVLVRATVVRWRAARPRARIRAGADVRLDPLEHAKVGFVEGALRGQLRPTRRRQTRVPVALAVRYRLEQQPAWTEGRLAELSAGGALLITSAPLPQGTSMVLELAPPGAEAPATIAAVVAYHGADGNTGLRFLARDSAGTRRLRELVRRVRAA